MIIETEKIKNLLEPLNSRLNWFDFITEYYQYVPIKFKNNKLFSINDKQNSGFGLRVNKDGKTGLSYTNSPDKLSRMITNAENISKFGEEEKFSLPDKIPTPVDLNNYADYDFRVNDEIFKGEALISSILEKLPESENDVSISMSKGSSLFINSGGLCLGKKSSFYSSSISTLLVDKNGGRTDIWNSLSGIASVDINNLAEKILYYAELSKTNRELAAGTYPVIFTPKAFSSLMSIILSGLSAISIYKKISPYYSHFNEKFYSEKLTIIDDPLLQGSAYSYYCDDEGVESKKEELISGGVIKSCVSNLKYASLLGLSPSGNSSRSYSDMPYPSFSNIVVLPGEVHSSALIKNVKRGILADQFLGLGQSNTITGDFSANIDLGFMIDNGEISGRLKDCMISGNLFDMLKSSIEFSSDSEKQGSQTLPYLYCGNVNFSK